MPAMHCLIATTGVAGGVAAGPELQALLRDWHAETPDLGGDPAHPDTPFERLLGQARGLTADAALPLGAWAAECTGLQAPAWALLTPLHLELDAQQALALPLAALALDDAESRALFNDLQPLFPDAQGWQSAYLEPTQWLIGHACLAELRCASVQRIVQRPLTPWLPGERWLRRLQNEAQMLLHAHPVNLARMARGALAVNSVWIHGAGAPAGQALPVSLVQEPHHPLDPEAATAHWQRLDAGPIAALRRAAAQGQPARLSLAGDVRARSWVPAKPRWRWPWQRQQAVDLGALLRELDQ